MTNYYSAFLNYTNTKIHDTLNTNKEDDDDDAKLQTNPFISNKTKNKGAKTMLILS